MWHRLETLYSVAVAFCMTLCELLCVTLSCHEGGLSFLTDGGACRSEQRLRVVFAQWQCVGIENLENHNAA